jgi:hypothetical protein
MRLMGGTRSKMEGAHNDKKTKITTITARVYIPLIHTFGSRKDTTTCEGGSERVKVCIKVCNPYFRSDRA